MEEFGVTSAQTDVYTAWFSTVLSSGLSGDLIWYATFRVGRTGLGHMMLMYVPSGKQALTCPRAIRHRMVMRCVDLCLRAPRFGMTSRVSYDTGISGWRCISHHPAARCCSQGARVKAYVLQKNRAYVSEWHDVLQVSVHRALDVWPLATAPSRSSFASVWHRLRGAERLIRNPSLEHHEQCDRPRHAHI